MLSCRLYNCILFLFGFDKDSQNCRRNTGKAVKNKKNRKSLVKRVDGTVKICVYFNAKIVFERAPDCRCKVVLQCRRQKQKNDFLRKRQKTNGYAKTVNGVFARNDYAC